MDYCRLQTLPAGLKFWKAFGLRFFRKYVERGKITVFRQGLHLEEGPGPAFFQMQTLPENCTFSSFNIFTKEP